MELFVDYGANYFPSRENIYGPIPGHEDYPYGDALLHNMIVMLDEIDDDENENASDETCTSEDQCMVDRKEWRFQLDSDLLTLSREIGVLWKGRPLLTLPENATHVEYLLEHGVKYLHYNRSIKSLEWLEENGLCSDNIKPGVSTIPSAGRGAFATRRIPKGALMAPVPLIHVPNRSIYNMYDSIVDTSWHHHSVVRDESKVIGHQLILNYCFGHRQSTLLLCPYGTCTILQGRSACFISHCLSLTTAIYQVSELA